jgi:hypothetical protein
VDLPRGSQLKMALSSAGAKFTHRPHVTREEYLKLVEQRWQELQALTEDEYGEPFIEPSKRIDVAEDAVLFAYKHTVLTLGPTKGDIIYSVEGYLWRDYTLYTFPPPQTNEIDEIIETMMTLQKRAVEEIPVGPGLCAAGSFFPGNVYGESVAFVFDIPARQGRPYFFRFETSTLYGEDARIMNRRRSTRELIPFLPSNSRIHIERDRDRTLAGMIGNESVAGFIENNHGSHSYGVDADWEFPGDIRSNQRPHILLSMGISYKTPEAPTRKGFPKPGADGTDPEEDFLAVWEAILKSLRPRPGATDEGR